MHTSEDILNPEVFTVREMPHFAPYLQFLVNIIKIHFELVKAGGSDYGISDTMNRADLEKLYVYLHEIEPGAPVRIGQKDARVLYACFVIVSRLMLCDYGEAICSRLIRNLDTRHPWSEFEVFRNTLLRHNAQMLMDMDNSTRMQIPGLEEIKSRLEAISL